MKKRPILFSGPMVRAILDGRKTQTRRAVKPQRHPYGEMLTPDEVALNVFNATCACRCPYGQPGDRLWVRETHAWLDRHIDGLYREDPCVVGYPSDDAILRFDPDPTMLQDRLSEYASFKLRPSIFMPRWASRITLEITSLRVERLQDITEEDAIKEGVCNAVRDGCGLDRNGGFVAGFCHLWDSINAKSHPWDSNPWVWRIEFRRVA